MQSQGNFKYMNILTINPEYNLNMINRLLSYFGCEYLLTSGQHLINNCIIQSSRI
eukprot:UN18791